MSNETWRRIDLDKNRKNKVSRDAKQGIRNASKEIKCKITQVFIPGELTDTERDKILDPNTYRARVRPIDVSNYGYARQLDTLVFVINEDPHYIVANFGVKGLVDKVISLSFTPPLLNSTATINLKGIMNYGTNLNEPDRVDALETEAFDIGKAILGLLPF